MNKIFLMFAAAATLGLASCTETWDGNPVLETHPAPETVVFLNNPILQDQYVTLTQDNKQGSFHMTCSQPQYGYAAITTYAVQICLDEQFNDGEYIELKTPFYDCAEINPINHEVAGAYQKLLGYESEADMPTVMDYIPLYFRLRAYIAPFETSKEDMTPEQAEAAGTSVYFSNVVCYKHVAADYYAVWKAGEKVNLYLRGGFNNWGTGEEWQFETGEEDNTWICRNVTIGANVSIKVSTDNWADINLGGDAGENDDSQMIDPDEKIEMTGGDNPGHLRLKTDFTGNVVLSLTDGKYFIIFETPQE